MDEQLLILVIMIIPEWTFLTWLESEMLLWHLVLQQTILQQ